MLRIAPLTSLVGQPENVLANYGGKTAGNIRLMQWADTSPVGFEVPKGFAVPPLAAGNYSTQDITEGYQNLVRGSGEPRVIMARSSALAEDTLPGSNETLLSVHNPSDPSRSLADFHRNVDALLASSREMGITVMPMVGRASLTESGHQIIGGDNLSFYATTHSPFNPLQALISVCHGLGHTAAFHSDQTIPIIAMRESGALVFLGNMTEKYGAKCIWLPEVKVFEQYRQQMMRVFNLGSGQIETLGTSSIFDGLSILHCLLGMKGDVEGRLWPFKKGDESEFQEIQREWKELIAAGKAGGYGYGSFGKTPFNDAKHLAALISVARYIGSFGPAQVEGCFSGGSGKLYLYQHLPLPNQPTNIDPISLSAPDVFRTESFGKIKFRGPFILAAVAGDKQRARFAELDAKFAETGYTLIAPVHNEEIIALTPHCRVRLSMWSQAMTSHVLTSLWLHHVKPENVGNFAMASGLLDDRTIDFYDDVSINGIAPNFRDDELSVHIFDAVDVEANGQNLAFKVVR